MTKIYIALLFLLLPLSLAAREDLSIETAAFEIVETAFESVVVRPANDASLPGLFMVPNWMGPNEDTQAKAEQIARMGYVVYLADVYSTEVRPTNSREAAAAAGHLREDRGLMRQRALAAYDHFRKIAPEYGVSADQFAAIGFCFGGGAVLEMARAGAPLDAVVTFHADLNSPTLEADSSNITGKVLVLHGADDPYVPREDVDAFQAALRATDVDWQFVSFGGAVHSFTDPTAATPGQAHYNEPVARRAFAYMNLLFDEVFNHHP